MIGRIEITGELDRGAVEALCLEVRRLARRHGVDVTAVRIEKVRGEAASFDEGEEPEGQEVIG
jgi:hypothetical protein